MEFDVIWVNLPINVRNDVETRAEENRVRYQVPVTVRLPNGSLEPGVAWLEQWGWAATAGGVTTVIAFYAITGGGRWMGGGGFLMLTENFQQ
ncbi:hypothetical protein HY469_01110 [Candidatus Roizmanbacteria bacterium]|nr:hypothetical protein [Candidatus Roizmanbacteria bacterium]